MKIPIIPRTQARMAPQTGGFLSVRANPDVFAAGGKGMQAAGDKITNLSSSWFDKEVKIRNSTEINNAKAQIIESQALAMEAAREGETQADATALYDRAMEESLSQINTEILTNRTTRRDFSQIWNLTRANDLVTVREHARVRITQKQEAVVLATVEGILDRDMLPGQNRWLAKREVEDTWREFGDSRDIDASEIEKRIIAAHDAIDKKYKFDFIRSTRSVVENSSPGEARAFIWGLSQMNEFTPAEWDEHIDDLNNRADANQRSYDKENGDRIKLEFLSAVDEMNAAGAKEFISGYEAWGELSDNARTRLELEGRAIIERLDNRIDGDHAAIVAANTKTVLGGFEPTPEATEEQRQLASQGIPSVTERQNQYEAVVEYVGGLTGLTPSQVAAEVALQQEASQTEGQSELEAFKLEASTNYLNQLIKDINADPNARALRDNHIARTEFDAFNRQSVRAAIAGRQTVQELYSGAGNYFTVSQQKALAAWFPEQSSANKSAWLGALRENAGEDTNEILAEIFGDSPSSLVYGHAGTLKPEDAALIFQGMDILNADQTAQKLNSNDARGFIQSKWETAWVPLNPKMRQAVQQAAEYHFMATTQQEGVIAKDDEKGFIESVEAVLGMNVLELNDRQTFIPEEVSIDAVKQFVAIADEDDWRALGISGGTLAVGVAPAVNDDGIMDQEQLQGAHIIMLNGGQSYGLAIMNGEVEERIFDESGQPFSFVFNPEQMLAAINRKELEDE